MKSCTIRSDGSTVLVDDYSVAGIVLKQDRVRNGTVNEAQRQWILQYALHAIDDYQLVASDVVDSLPTTLSLSAGTATVRSLEDSIGERCLRRRRIQGCRAGFLEIENTEESACG